MVHRNEENHAGGDGLFGLEENFLHGQDRWNQELFRGNELGDDEGQCSLPSQSTGLVTSSTCSTSRLGAKRSTCRTPATGVFSQAHQLRTLGHRSFCSEYRFADRRDSFSSLEKRGFARVSRCSVTLGVLEGELFVGGGQYQDMGCRLRSE